LDFTIESYHDILEVVQKYEQDNGNNGKKNKKTIAAKNNKTTDDPEESEEKLLDLNKISKFSLYDLMIELIKTKSNIFLYGYGSKLKIIYDFIQYFQSNVNGVDSQNYYLLTFNCYNPEINLKFILNEIQGLILNLLEQIGCSDKELKEVTQKYKTLEDQVYYIDELRKILKTKEFHGKFIIIMNNIDGPNLQNKIFQSIIATLVNITGFILITTSDNLYINHFWTQTMKDNFSFYFLKYNTFSPYELEINDKNSLTGEKNIKSGTGFGEILKSLTKNHRDVIKIMAEIQMKGDLTQMTPKALVDYMTDHGFGVCNSQNRFMELILEPRDHEIIVERLLPKTNKQIYKLNLDNEILEKIVNGEFDGESF
jgi:hypothetical protein